METQRQKKIAGVIQKDLADILQRAATDGGFTGTIISVSKVSVTVDLSLAKVYISIFPQDQIEPILKGIQANPSVIRTNWQSAPGTNCAVFPNWLFTWTIRWIISKTSKNPWREVKIQ